MVTLKTDKGYKQYFYLYGIIGAILLVVLFPVWPMFVKKLIFNISLYLLIVIVGNFFFNLTISVWTPCNPSPDLNLVQDFWNRGLDSPQFSSR